MINSSTAVTRNGAMLQSPMPTPVSVGPMKEGRLAMWVRSIIWQLLRLFVCLLCELRAMCELPWAGVMMLEQIRAAAVTSWRWAEWRFQKKAVQTHIGAWLRKELLLKPTTIWKKTYCCHPFLFTTYTSTPLSTTQFDHVAMIYDGACKNVIGFYAQLHMKSKSLSKRELSNDPLTQAFCKTLQLLLLQIVPPQTDLGNIAPI